MTLNGCAMKSAPAHQTDPLGNNMEKQQPDPGTLRGAWYYIYGEGSHMNLAGKLLIGVPFFPAIATFVVVWVVLDALFTKR